MRNLAFTTYARYVMFVQRGVSMPYVLCVRYRPVQYQSHAFVHTSLFANAFRTVAAYVVFVPRSYSNTEGVR